MAVSIKQDILWFQIPKRNQLQLNILIHIFFTYRRLQGHANDPRPELFRRHKIVPYVRETFPSVTNERTIRPQDNNLGQSTVYAWFEKHSVNELAKIRMFYNTNSATHTNEGMLRASQYSSFRLGMLYLVATLYIWLAQRFHRE